MEPGRRSRTGVGERATVGLQRDSAERKKIGGKKFVAGKEVEISLVRAGALRERKKKKRESVKPASKTTHYD